VERFVHRELRRTYVQGNSDEELLCIVLVVLYSYLFRKFEGASLRFKRMSEHYNIRTDFKTKYFSGIYLRKTKHLKGKLERSNC
jgi:hypothetical protein